MFNYFYKKIEIGSYVKIIFDFGIMFELLMERVLVY